MAISHKCLDLVVVQKAKMCLKLVYFAFCQLFVLNFQVGTFNLFSVLERMLEWMKGQPVLRSVIKGWNGILLRLVATCWILLALYTSFPFFNWPSSLVPFQSWYAERIFRIGFTSNKQWNDKLDFEYKPCNYLEYNLKSSITFKSDLKRYSKGTFHFPIPLPNWV